MLGIDSASKNVRVADFLFRDVPKVDLVVGNPPYVRYENIPEYERTLFKDVFVTFHYRADLYVPFF